MKTNQLQTNIPDGWKFHKLDDLLTFVVDNRGKTPPIQSSGIPMAEVNAIGDKNIKYSEITKFVSEETYKTWFRKHLEKNDILFSTVGRTASCSIYTADIKTVIAQNLIGLRFGKDNPEFMFYLLTQDKNNQEFKNIEMSAAQPSVKVSQMIHLEFLVPPLPEQSRIVAVLETWDKSIEKLSKKIEIKKIIKKGLMQDLLTGKKRLKGFSDKWESVKLGEIATFKKGKGLPKSEMDSSGKYEAIHYGELFTKYNEQIEDIISRTNSNKNMFLSKKNDILMPTSDVTPRGLSTASYIDKDGVILGGDILVIRSTGNLHGLFFCYLVNLNKKDVIKLVSGSTVFHLYGSDMAKFELKLPPLKEQESIVKILITADKEITELEKKLNIIKDQKKYLLNNLITGTIRTSETLSTKTNK